MLATDALSASSTARLATSAGYLAVHSAQDLRRAVGNARGLPLTFDASALDRVLHCDTTHGLVEVQSETTWKSLALRFSETAPELSALASDAWLPERIGASVARNAPGPDGRALVTHVESIALVTPDAELRRVSRGLHPELFRCAVGGHGAFGLIYSVTLRLDSLRRCARTPSRDALLQFDTAGMLPTRRLDLHVSEERLDELLTETRGLAAGWRIALVRIDVRRATYEEPTRLNPARADHAMVALRLQVPPGLGGIVRTKQFAREAIGLALKLGGGFGLETGTDATREQAELGYPALSSFLAEKLRYDPLDRLQTNFYRHYRNLLRHPLHEARGTAEPAALAQAVGS